MIPYTYLTTRDCMARYPVVYNDPPNRPREPNKYLVLHEIVDRYNNNWGMGDQWRRYRGVITWNPKVYEDNKHLYNMLFCRQYMNMHVEGINDIMPFADRERGLCVIYGSPASVDTPIMMARYDVPLELHRLGLNVNAYGIIPPRQRPEYRDAWQSIFRGDIPVHRKQLQLGKHKFSICFENSRHPYHAMGWVTEKIYDCLGCGCIPIYWGAPNITDHVPPEAFVDWRNFKNARELYSYLTETPDSVFAEMQRIGKAFHDTVHFDEYLKTYEGLK